jgi:hypothetical protein
MKSRTAFLYLLVMMSSACCLTAAHGITKISRTFRATPQLAANPRFTSMDITFIIGVAKKEPETRLEVFLVHDDGKPDAAYLDVHGQGHAPGSTITPLPAVPRRDPVGHGVASNVPALYLKDLGIGNPDPAIHEMILVKVTHDTGTNKGNSWNFNFNVVLHFDDGTRVLLSSPAGYTLSPGNHNFQGLWNLKTAVIARPEVASES